MTLYVQQGLGGSTVFAPKVNGEQALLDVHVQEKLVLADAPVATKTRNVEASERLFAFSGTYYPRYGFGEGPAGDSGFGSYGFGGATATTDSFTVEIV